LIALFDPIDRETTDSQSSHITQARERMNNRSLFFLLVSNVFLLVGVRQFEFLPSFRQNTTSTYRITNKTSINRNKNPIQQQQQHPTTIAQQICLLPTLSRIA
jgi:hypothetical protein